MPPAEPGPLRREGCGAGSGGVSPSGPGVEPGELPTAKPGPLPHSVPGPLPTSVPGPLPGAVSDETRGGLRAERAGEVLAPWQGQVAAHDAIWGREDGRRWQAAPARGTVPPPVGTSVCTCSRLLAPSALQDWLCVSQDSRLCMSSTSAPKGRPRQPGGHSQP